MRFLRDIDRKLFIVRIAQAINKTCWPGVSLSGGL